MPGADAKTGRRTVTDESRLGFWGRSVEPERMKLVQACLRPGSKVLDYGCGQGAYVANLQARGIECIGADLLPFPEWKRVAESLGVTSEELFRQVSDAELPYPNNSFDLVCGFEVLEHCQDPMKTLRELVRVGRRDFTLSVPDCSLDTRLRTYSFAFAHWTDTTHLNFFDRSSFCELLENAGLTVESVGGAFELDLNACFWGHVRAPGIIRRFGYRLLRSLKLVPSYYSAILVHARKPT